MAKVDLTDIFYSKNLSPLEFNFENLMIPPMGYYLSDTDVEELRKIATSVRLSSKIQIKYKMIDDIMRSRGFKRFSAGTNRVVYAYLEDQRFLVKIAVDKVGMQDNPMEYENQHLLKPFVTKMFYMSPCGTVAFVERVLPIKNKEEFREIADDVFEILVNKIIGKYVIEDVGTKFFMNWGVRYGYGPVLLDYPYLYELDGKKLYCQKKLEDGSICNGEIDYDQAFNYLICEKCGKRYYASDLRTDTSENKLVKISRGGKHKMATYIKRNGVIVNVIEGEESTITKNPAKQKQPTGRRYIQRNGVTVAIIEPDGRRIDMTKQPEPQKKVWTQPIIEEIHPDEEEPNIEGIDKEKLNIPMQEWLGKYAPVSNPKPVEEEPEEQPQPEAVDDEEDDELPYGNEAEEEETEDPIPYNLDDEAEEEPEDDSEEESEEESKEEESDEEKPAEKEEESMDDLMTNPMKYMSSPQWDGSRTSNWPKDSNNQNGYRSDYKKKKGHNRGNRRYY